MPTGDDVEQFAALLRRLKDRTDRSYGSLARRVNMNTSTLHRYCAGEAVPQDYAPVERLAAFCGATPEERLELHRLWLLAVAARQRARAGDGAAEPKGAEGAANPAKVMGTPEPTGGERAPGPDSRPAPGAAGGADGAVGDGSGIAAAGSSIADDGRRNGDDGSGIAGAGSGIAGARSGTRGVPPRLDAGAPGAAGLPASDAPGPGSPEPAIQRNADRSTRRPWYHRRRTLVATAAATVLLVTLGGLSVLSAGRSHGTSAEAPGRTRAPGTAAAHHPPTSATSPSPSLSPASPSAAVRASESPETKGGPSGSTGSHAPVPAGVPLAWTADSHIWLGGCGHDYVIDKEPAQVPPPPMQQDAGVWAATQGAVHGRQTMVQISVQGQSSTAVVLEGLRVRVVSRGTPVTGTTYAMDHGCGGGLTAGEFSVNLDVSRPIAHPRPGNDGGKPLPRFPYRVSAEDPEVLMVTATTEAYDCEWYLELDWSSQGRTGTVRIDDHGRPFRTSGIEGLPRYWYGTNSQGLRQWVPTGT